MSRKTMAERAVEAWDGVISPGTLPEYDEESEIRTRQSDADAADVNKILERIMKTGVFPQVEREGFFGDVSDVGDYREALERVSKADQSFKQLPAKVRAAFWNDPAEFLDAFQDPEGLKKLRELEVIPPGREEQLDAEEGAAEARAAKRAAARAKAERIKAAESDNAEKGSKGT